MPTKPDAGREIASDAITASDAEPSGPTAAGISERTPGPNDLATEDISLYLKLLPSWHEHRGEHVLIYKGKVHGFYGSRDYALKEGFRRFGRVPFLVKEVNMEEKPRPLVGVFL